ncbi:heavy-metal-associated domain-containing protein [Dictyobacter kobayashii]|uniref:HMA domain-containing protein n=1 Tax=Dictyobacter kobayashii TaxID=2014872 RepID=A0A402AQ37_9CHLR|nr:heavy-metal-associated domain-containing protein [Dictyobacter kobayashii]GCE21110.1 hypothetical protein KDK_49100 [Dictyobacter kobayashii]
MSYQQHFLVEDVTCEKCDARIRSALESLPGTEQVELTRTPHDEASVVLTTSKPIPPELIETAIIGQSVGTTHNYQVRWDTEKHEPDSN